MGEDGAEGEEVEIPNILPTVNAIFVGSRIMAARLVVGTEGSGRAIGVEREDIGMFWLGERV